MTIAEEAQGAPRPPDSATTPGPPRILHDLDFVFLMAKAVVYQSIEINLAEMRAHGAIQIAKARAYLKHGREHPRSAGQFRRYAYREKK